MRGMITTLLLVSGVSLSSASIGWNLTGAADTTVNIRNSGSGKGLTVRSPDVAVQATGDYTAVEGTTTQSGGTAIQGTAGGWFSTGVHGQSEFIGVRASSDYGVGLEAYGGSTAISAYGPYDGIAVYAQASGPFSYAGLFDGNVYVNGSCNPCSPSDEKFKKDIKDLEGALAKIMSLKPKTYTMKTKEYADRIKLAEGNQYGFLAQDLEAVLPDMVHPAKVTLPLKEAKSPDQVKTTTLEFKGISYTDLIPVLVRAIQEQQAEIEALKKRR